jgi:hypothetical protein
MERISQALQFPAQSQIVVLVLLMVRVQLIGKFKFTMSYFRFPTAATIASLI